MNLKRVTVIGTMLFCALFTIRFAGYGQAKRRSQESKSNKDVVAIINGGRVITKKEVDESIGVKLYEMERKRDASAFNGAKEF